MLNNSEKKKLAIIHFQPLEGYPPVMNDIHDFLKVGNLNLSVFSTASKDEWFMPDQGAYFRYGFADTNNPFYRYLTYLFFNFYTFLRLILSRPSNILVYETLSIFPVFLLKLVWRDIKLHIHFHEYTSPEEIRKSSVYFKWLIILEKKMYKVKNCSWSHTNEDRVGLYLKDNPELDAQKVFVFPNYPPYHWYENSNKNKKERSDSEPIRLVHVGALSLDTTYVKEMVEWVIAANGNYELDFYLSNIDRNTELFLNKAISDYSFIHIFPKVKYFDLPNILKDYDVGLVLYNGNIPNYIYNVPNKVMEYLACGMEVWYSDKLLSTKSFTTKYNIKGCHEINFLELKGFPKFNTMNDEKNEYYLNYEKMLHKVNFIIGVPYN